MKLNKKEENKIEYFKHGEGQEIKVFFAKECKECKMMVKKEIMKKIVFFIGKGFVTFYFCSECAPTIEIAWKKTLKIATPALKNIILEAEGLIKEGQSLDNDD